jgi:hypothetical protein
MLQEFGLLQPPIHCSASGCSGHKADLWHALKKIHDSRVRKLGGEIDWNVVTLVL